MRTAGVWQLDVRRSRFREVAARCLLTLLVAGASVAPARSARASDVPISEEARKHFTVGVDFLNDPDGARYEEAFAAFQAAYAASPSWKILGNLGICAMKLERDGEAITAFKKYLEQGGKEIDAQERRQVERDLTALETSRVVLRLQLTPALTLIDTRQPNQGAAIVNRYGPLQGAVELTIHPGHHRLVAQAAGYQDAQWEFEAVPGGSAEHSITLSATAAPTLPPPEPVAPLTAPVEPAPAPRAGWSTGIYIGIGATAAFAAGGTIFGVRALNENAAPDRTKDSVNQANLIADLMWGGTAVAAGVTGYLLYRHYSDKPATSASHTAWYPVVDTRGGGLVMSGRF